MMIELFFDIYINYSVLLIFVITITEELKSKIKAPYFIIMF